MKKLILIILFISFAISKSDEAMKQIVKQYESAVVLIYNETTQSFGSGFFINGEGWILTNWHVVNHKNNRIKVFLQNSSSFTSNTILTKVDDYCNEYEYDENVINSDFALVKINLKNSSYFKFPNKENLVEKGEDVVTIGHPGGEIWTTTDGKISNIDENRFLFTAPISSGNSGGPLINKKNGLVLGINTAVKSNMQNTNIAPRYEKIKEWLLSQRVAYYESNYNDNVFEIKENKREVTAEEVKLENEKARIRAEADLLREKYKNEEEERERELQEEKRNMNLKKRFMLKVGGSFGLNLFDIETHLNNEQNALSYNYKKVNSFLGFRTGTLNEYTNSNLWGLFVSFAKNSENSNNKSRRINNNNELLPQNYDTKSYQIEGEFGAVFGESFRISTGLGQIKYNQNEIKINKTYLISSIGLCGGWRVVEFQTNYSAMYLLDIKQVNHRFEVGLNINIGLF